MSYCSLNESEKKKGLIAFFIFGREEFFSSPFNAFNVTSIQVCQLFNLFMLGSKDGTVAIWTPPETEPTNCMNFSGAVRKLKFVKSSFDHLLVGVSKRGIYTVEWRTGVILQLFTPTEPFDLFFGLDIGL